MKTLTALFILLIVLTISTATSNSDSTRNLTDQSTPASFQQLVDNLHNQQVNFAGRDGKFLTGTLSKGANDYLVITYTTRVVDYVPYTSVLMLRTPSTGNTTIYLK